VLCVDDNHDVADSEAELLGAYGFEARACYDGPSALAAAPGFRPDVCLVDLNMPGMDGAALAPRLRAQAGGAALVLVAVTAMSDARSAGRVAAAGFDRHLVKPVAPEALLALVARAGRADSA
jgi:CheY-like chemotaxis protein